MSNKFKKIKTIDGTNIKLELIEDISKYRGFYFIFPNGDKTKANYNSFCLKDLEKIVKEHSEDRLAELEALEIQNIS